jgi:hypothetical protein
MSKRPFEGQEEEGEHARRVRARVELEEEIADLPYEMQQLILEEGSLRTVMRFAQASKQSEEIAARAFVAIFKRDIMTQLDRSPEAKHKAKASYLSPAIRELILEGIPQKGVLTNNEYKRVLGAYYKETLEWLADRFYWEIIANELVYHLSTKTVIDPVRNGPLFQITIDNSHYRNPYQLTILHESVDRLVLEGIVADSASHSNERSLRTSYSEAWKKFFVDLFLNMGPSIYVETVLATGERNVRSLKTNGVTRKV